MNILSIGNSYSQDAQRYLHQIAKAAGVELNCYNLYIGGCALSRHYRNMLSEQAVYGLGVNGMDIGFQVSLKEALLNREWDVVTVQQASHFSTDYKTYQPYLKRMVEYIRLCAPPRQKFTFSRPGPMSRTAPVLRKKWATPTRWICLTT